MARSISSVLTASMNAQETSEVFVALIAISHPLIVGGPLRLVQDLQDLTSNGNVYTAFPFQVVLPEESDDGVPTLSLMLDNVSQEIVSAVKALPPSSPPTVQVDLVLRSTPNVIEISFPNLTLRDVSGDMLQIEGTLRMDEEDLVEYPEGSFTPADFPGLFA